MNTRKKQFSVEFQPASPHDVSINVWRDKKSVKATALKLSRPSHARGGQDGTTPTSETRGGRINNYSLYSRTLQSWNKPITRSTTPDAISEQNRGLTPVTPCSCVSCLLTHALQEANSQSIYISVYRFLEVKGKYHSTKEADWLK
jgi:hypothetical protein